MTPPATHAFDVGKHGVGCSLFSAAGELGSAWYERVDAAAVSPTGWSAIAERVLAEARRRRGTAGGFVREVVVLETMELHKFSKSRPADILNLQGIVGALAGAFGCLGATVVGYPAREWKGQVPRDIFGNRVADKVAARGWDDRVPVVKRKVLTKDELNDVHHAIGLGAYYLELTGVPVWVPRRVS